MGECAVPAKAEREGSKVGGVDVYVCEKAVAVAGMAGVDEPRGGGGDGRGDDPGAMNSLMPSFISTRLLRSSQSTSGDRSILIFARVGGRVDLVEHNS